MNEVKQKFKDATGVELDDEQILLVGSNPLPIVVAALALQPAGGVHLVHTAGVVPRVERIAALLQARGVRVASTPCLNDPHSAPRILEALAADFGHVDWSRVGLHYTGGTKPMAAQIHAYWNARRGCLAQASYLDTDAVLRFESGGSGARISLRDAPRLTLDELTDLHMGVKSARAA